MGIRKSLWMMMVICLGAFIGVGCGNKAPEVEMTQDEPGVIAPEVAQESVVAQQGGDIKIAMRSPKTLNPILNMDKTVDKTLKLVFDTLVDFNEQDEVVPNLAKSWIMSGEGTVLDITLDPSIKWHDGAPLTPEDVIFSIKTIQEAVDSPYKPSIKNIISYTPTENNGVRIVYKESFSGYGHTLYFPIIPAHIENIGTHPIGTGAYVFESSVTNREMILKHNINYFKGEPNISKIKVLFTPDDESDLYSFDQGLIDVVSTDVIDWEKYAKNKKSNINEYMTLNYDYIGMNFNKPIFQDIKMRQALLYATNREYLLEKFYLYHGHVTDVPISPSSWLYEPNSKEYEADVEKAKELLGDSTSTIELLVNANNMQRVNVANALKKMYKDVGVTLEILEVDEAAFVERVQNKQYDLFLGGWDLSVIPDLSFAFHSAYADTGTNYGNYKNEKMDNLLKEAFNAKSNEQLKEVYSKLQLYISEQLPYLSLHFRTAALITNEKIKGDIKPHHMNVYQNIYEWYTN
ncbi:MAG TPA: peptide ABC transporter substrate-binding protein [Epulopiscium sp.]|nr:peptide ABC transporter substrate-binding protein [Candidatus Epulonipiscium sp.]